MIVIAGGFGVWRLTRSSATDGAVQPVAYDAQPGETLGIFAIDPIPEGAKGTIVGADGVVHEFGPTSHASVTRLKVSANEKLKVHIELAGYMSFDDTRTVLPGETMVIAPRLAKAHAGLHVVTTPPGAQVTVDKKLLGETPLKLAPISHAVSAGAS